MLEKLTQYSSLIDVLIGLGTLVGLVWGGWLAVRKPLGNWWGPWRDSFKAIGQLPLALATLSGLQGQINTIEKQVKTDDGRSIPDTLQGLKAGQFESHTMIQNISCRVEQASMQLTRLSCTFRANQDSDPRRATFECHADGRTEEVNKTYLRWVGLELKEVIGFGWLNAVHPEDRPRVRSEWQLAVSESRTCSLRFRMVSSDGEVFTVESTATPIPEGQAPPDRWVGIIFKVDA